MSSSWHPPGRPISSTPSGPQTKPSTRSRWCCSSRPDRRLGGPARGGTVKTVLMDIRRPEQWPEHLPVGALRVVRWSARYAETVAFYRDIVGLPVLESFHASYGLDGTILGLPGGPVHLEIVRLPDDRRPVPGLDQLV